MRYIARKNALIHPNGGTGSPMIDQTPRQLSERAAICVNGGRISSMICFDELKQVRAEKND
jgi:hypothetical protein